MTTVYQEVKILDYDVIVQIKNTSNCIAYKVKDPKTKKPLVLKVIYAPYMHPDLIYFLKNEYISYAKTINPYLLSIKKCKKTDDHFFLIYEFCNQGNLEFFLKQQNFDVNLQTKLYLIKEMIFGYSELIKQGFTKRDIKLHNIMISNGKLKVGDIENLMKSHVSLRKNYYNYMPPEELKPKGPIDPLKKDIWCLGVNMFYIIFGRLPFLKQNKEELYNDISNMINKKDPMEFFIQMDPNRKCTIFYSILAQTLDFEPSNRVTIDQLASNEIFKKEYEKPEFPEVTLEDVEEEEKNNEKKGSFLYSLFGSTLSIESYGLSHGKIKISEDFNPGDWINKKKKKDEDITSKHSGFCLDCFFKFFKKKKI